jgi:hypothetical protein
MNWDNGRTLSLIPDEDSFRTLTLEEKEAELTSGDVAKHSAPVME